MPVIDYCVLFFLRGDGSFASRRRRTGLPVSGYAGLIPASISNGFSDTDSVERVG